MGLNAVYFEKKSLRFEGTYFQRPHGQGRSQIEATKKQAVSMICSDVLTSAWQELKYRMDEHYATNERQNERH
jgi:hypothetical protein